MAPLDVSTGPSYGTVASTQHIEEERYRLLQDPEEESLSGETDSTDDVQEGVRKIEAISLTWTTRSLIIAYVRYVVLYRSIDDPTDQRSIFLMAFCTSLEGQTISSLSAYATSAFSEHSLISTVLVVQNVVNGDSNPR